MGFSTPDLRSLRTLQAIRDTGSLAEAARRLRLTPSALSHQLREIEAGIGRPALHRKTRPPRFTPAGERLLALADQVLAACDEAGREIARLQADAVGSLVLEIGDPAFADWLLPVLARFRARWPEIGVDFRAGEEDVQAGAAVLVLGSSPSSGSDIADVPLFDYEMMLLVSPTHALAGRAFVRSRDLAGETLLTCPGAGAWLQGEFPARTSGVRPAHMRQVDSLWMLVPLVAAGRGVALLPGWTAAVFAGRGDCVAVRAGDGANGGWNTYRAALREADLAQAWVQDFIESVRVAALATLHGVRPVAAGPA